MSIAEPGVGQAARRGLGTLGEMALTRLELAATELALARAVLVAQLFWGALGTLLLALAWGLAVAAWLWWVDADRRGLAFGLAFALTAGAAACSLWQARRRGRAAPALLVATQRTLREDLDALRARDDA
jgi:uncharacterized membrane protein YqjE